MSRASIHERASRIRRAPIYGIGRLAQGAESSSFEIGWDDYAKDVEWAESILLRSGIGHGDIVLMTTPNCDGPWSGAFAAALKNVGAVYTVAEPYNWDARRVASLLGRLPVKAFFGLGRETLEALADSPTPFEELASDVEVIWAHTDAAPLLSRVNATVLPYVKLGPAVGLGVPNVTGALVDPTQWSVEESAEGLVVSTVGDRTARFDRYSIGSTGRVNVDSDDQKVVIRR